MSAAAIRSGDLPHLGVLEALVMDVLWDHGTSTVRDIIGRLPAERAYTTIATVLRNLERKGLVGATRHQHATHYTACVSRGEHTVEVLDRVLAASTDRSEVLLRFVDSMSDHEVEMLRAHLNREGSRPVPDGDRTTGPVSSGRADHAGSG